MIITYLIKSTLCLAVLFGFYKVALESKALHQFKRYYLLASLVFSLTIPLVTFTYTTATVPQDIWVENFVSIQDQNITPSPPVVIKEKTNYLSYVLWSIYGIGIFIFGGRFTRNLVRLKRKITTAETHRQPGFTLALLQQTIIPHSFLKYIFLSRKRYENKEIPPEVIAHEATHVRQKHSLDILFIEFLQVIFWFNPLFWITKKSITLNHEFLADQGAIQEQHDIYQYQNILLRYASSTHHTTLESPFNYSSTKKRILMLSQSFNRKRLAISALLLIPIIAGCVLIFNQGIIAQPNNDLAIEGHWIDKKHENTNVSIYKENDVLWWDMNNNKTPITTKNGEYYIDLAPHNRAIDKKIKLSIENELLKVGDNIYYITLENTISHRIHGIWMTPDGDTKYHFNGINGGTTCDVINISENKSARYYPNLIDNGMTFTMGHDWVTFTFEGEQLITQDGVKLNRVKEKVYARSIDINILDDTHFEVDGIKTARKNLQHTLASLHKDLSKEQRDRVINIHVSSKKDISYQDLVFLQKIATNYGYHRIVTPKEEIIRSKGNTPMADQNPSEVKEAFEAIYQQTTNNYATEFVEGAERNGKKALVIEIRNNTVRVNGKASSVATLHSDIDAITKDWSQTAYKEMSPSFLYKNSDKEFIEKVNQEFQKTYLTSQVKGLELRPSSDQEMRNAYVLTSTRDHLEKMKNLGSLFYFNEKEISFEQAIELTEKQKDLSIKTPYPYTNPPKTYISGKSLEVVEVEKLVIEIKNNTVRVNGKPSSVETLRSDIDAITKDWSQADYTEAYPSTLVKNPDKGFIKKLNEEFLKTKFSKANGGMDLLPPPPPAPPAPEAPKAQVPPPPPPPSIEEHIKSMHEIGGVFYYENETISYEKALNLVKTNKNLNVQTRSPYTTAPKTYISKEPITFSPKDQNKKPVTKKDIAVYNKLAKKYGKNPNGQILKKEVAFMYDIYNRMTEKQKKNAESYPALPPPPPPAPVKVKETPKAQKGTWEVKTNNEVMVNRVDFLSSKIEKHALKNGVFELDGKLITKEEALTTIKYPYIGIAEYHTTSPIKMTITKDPATTLFDIYYKDKLLTESEYNNIAADQNLKLVKVSDKTKDKKAVYTLQEQ